MTTTRERAGRGLDRRAVLRAAGLGLAGGALAVGGAGLIASLGSRRRVLDRPLSAAEIRALVARTGVADGPIPEYRKRASLVVLPREAASVHVASGRSVQVDNTASIEDIIELLPEDSWLLPAFCLWNQDPFTTVAHNGGLRCVLPSITPPYSPAGDFESVASYLRYFLPEVEIVRAPFPFEGGNLRFDEIAGQRLAFGEFAQVDQAAACRTFRVDRAIHLACRISLRGTGLHLDELMIFLGDQRVGVVQLTGPDDGTEPGEFRALEEHLEQMRAILGHQLGYTVIDLPCSRADYAASRTFTNCLQFTDGDGRHHVLVPDFGRLRQPAALAEVLSVYRASGAVVGRVRIATAALSGGLHCLTNVLV